MQEHPFFVTTKFAPPRMSAAVLVRTRLLAALARAAEGTLTCVVAGAGLGKTLLLAQWRQSLGPLAPVAWLSLGADEARLESFTAYLWEAVRRAGVNLETPAPAGGMQPDAAALAGQLINAIASHPQRVWLFIDDCHCVTDARVHALLQRLLEAAPPNLRVAIASRSAPPISLARLRVSGQATVLDAGALAFDLQETRAFIDAAVAPPLPLEDAQALFEISGGWPAGLQLVAIALQRQPEARARVRHLAGKSADLHAYLAEEVMRHLPMDLVDFAESISVCRRFDARLAEALIRRPAASFIEVLVRDGLFIYRLESPDAEPWYRLHPIFADYLSARLARRGTAAVQELHRRAGRALAGRRLLAEALRHARLGEDDGLALEAISASSPGHWNMKDLGPLLPWLSRFAQQPDMPPAEFGAVASLAFAMTARPAQARSWLARSGAGPASPHVAVARAALALQADNLDDAERLLDGTASPGADAPLLASARTIIRATIDAIQGRTGATPQIEARMGAAPGSRLPDRDHECVAVTSATLLPALVQGNVAWVTERGFPMLAGIESAHGRRSIAANLCAALLADASYAMNREESARLLLAGRMDMLRASTPEAAIRAMLCHARLQPDLPLALAEVDEAHRHFEDAGLRRGVAASLATGVQLALRAGNDALAAAYLRRLQSMEVADGVATNVDREVQALVAMSVLRVAAAAEDAAAAAAAALLVRRFARRSGRRLLRAQALAILGSVVHRSGRIGLARKLLRVLAGQCKRYGWGRLWLDEHAGVRSSAWEMLRTDADGVPDLAALRCSLAAPDTAPRDASAPANEGPGLLTDRERQILELLGDSMSNKHIAGTLSISVETVKWYLKGIYGKLQVGSRYEALAKARSLGLLSGRVPI